VVAACEREERNFRLEPSAAEKFEFVPISPEGVGGAPPEVATTGGNRYDENAYHLSEGKRLYVWFNCNGCHANGGGGMGPALMDGRWKYGSGLADIAASIRDGRSNGMPAFRDKIPAEQIWQVAGYVSTIARLRPSGAEPGRNDEMQARPAENRAPAAMPASSPPEGPTQSR
jgi:cytochrome c oxidase cbb3-type subunit 3